MLFRLNCTDEEILNKLINNRFQIKKTSIKRIRFELGLARKMYTLDREAIDVQLFGLYFKRQGRLVTR